MNIFHLGGWGLFLGGLCLQTLTTIISNSTTVERVIIAKKCKTNPYTLGNRDVYDSHMRWWLGDSMLLWLFPTPLEHDPYSLPVPDWQKEVLLDEQEEGSKRNAIFESNGDDHVDDMTFEAL